MRIRLRASFIIFRPGKSEHTLNDRIVWRRNVPSAFIMDAFTQPSTRGHRGDRPCPLRVLFVATERRALNQILKYTMYDMLVAPPPNLLSFAVPDRGETC